jgi:fibronectin-binding autotransporter adhesin
MRLFRVIWLALVLPLAQTVAQTTNSWTNAVSGKWETAANWSLGAPSISQAALLVTNAGNKNVTMDATTAGSFPGTLTISNLTFSAPTGNTNTLVMSGLGASSFKILSNLLINTGGVVSNVNSTLEVNGSSTNAVIIEGALRLFNTSTLVVTNGQLNVGHAGAGILTATGATIQVRDVIAGNLVGSSGTFSMAGGTGTLSGGAFAIGSATNATGAVWLTGGAAFNASAAGFSAVGANGAGTMTLSNSTAVLGAFHVGRFSGGRGTLAAVGSTLLFAGNGLTVGTLANATGTVFISGGTIGTNDPTIATFISIGSQGLGQMTATAMTMRVQTLVVGVNHTGTLNFHASTNIAPGVGFTLTVGSVAGSTGVVWMSNSQFSNVTVGSAVGLSGFGEMTMSNSTFVTRSLYVGSNTTGRGILRLVNSDLILSNELNVGNLAGATGEVWVAGNITVTNAIGGVPLSLGGSGSGQLTLSSGVVRVGSGLFGMGGFSGARGTLTIAGGTLISSGSILCGAVAGSRGQIWVNGGTLIGSSLLRFNVQAAMDVSNGVANAGTIDFGNNPAAIGSLTVAGGQVNAFLNLTMGNSACTGTGIITIAGGTLAVTNAAANAAMVINNGTFTQSGGTVLVNNLVLSNACARFLRTGGTLSANVTNMNAALDVDGDGFSGAQELAGGSDPFNPFSIPTQTIWTNASSGHWEVDSNWSASAPSSAHQLVLITNAATKSVTINASTPAGHLTISNLLVSAPVGAVNTLQLTNAGTATPLRLINGLTISTNALLIVSNSAIQVDGRMGGSLVVDGGMTNFAGARVVVTNLTLGSFAGSRGQMTTLDGYLQSSNTVFVGLAGGSECTLSIAGGTNDFQKSLGVGHHAGATGAVWVTGGLLYVRPAFNTSLIVGNLGVGQMTVSNGSVRALTFQIGPNGGQGTLTIAGGQFDLDSDMTLGHFSVSTATVWMTSGSLIMTNGSMTVANFGNAQTVVSNGIVRALTIAMAGGSGRGTLTVNGGITSINSLNVGNASSGTGTVWLTGGLLSVTNKFFAAPGVTVIGRLGSGALTVSNGTLLNETIIIGQFAPARGTLTIAGGLATATNVTVGLADCTTTGAIHIAGGNFIVTNSAGNATLDVRSGVVQLTSGTLVVDKIVMTNACSTFVRTGGTLMYGEAVLDPARDDDGDGLSNGYEQANGLDPLNPFDDADGDGAGNLQELLAGTNPTNAASFFGITAIARERDNIRVTWMTGPGKTNALERSGTITGSFAVLTNIITTGTTTNALDLGAATNGPAFFYRVRLAP